jgi:hypothetical protein
MYAPLTCREFVELVTEFQEGALAGSLYARARAHLARCSGCAAFAEQMRDVAAGLRELPRAPSDRAPLALLAAVRGVLSGDDPRR